MGLQIPPLSPSSDTSRCSHTAFGPQHMQQACTMVGGACELKAGQRWGAEQACGGTRGSHCTLGWQQHEMRGVEQRAAATVPHRVLSWTATVEGGPGVRCGARDYVVGGDAPCYRGGRDTTLQHADLRPTHSVVGLCVEQERPQQCCSHGERKH